VKVIRKPRMGGKTFEAVQWLEADTHRVLLVMSTLEAARLRREYGLDAGQVLAAHEVARLEGRHPLVIGVDNIDLLGWRTLLKLGHYEHYIELVTETS
jgi:hypothetical protein